MVSLPDSCFTLTVESLPLGIGLDGQSLADTAAIEECCNWLRLHRLWGQLPDPALQDIVDW